MSKEKALLLQQLANELLYEDDGNEYYDADKWQQLHAAISQGIRQLLPLKGNTIEEEAEICLALLMGNRATFRNEKTIQQTLRRTSKVLPLLSPSLLKCSLLVYSYGETEDESLAREAHRIIEIWQKRKSTNELQRITVILSVMEEGFAYCQ